jgi:cyclic-di-GMP-binding protein
MPNFDIVSELNQMEVENAFNQARKEVAQRFDFRGTETTLERDAEGAILVEANSEGRCEAAYGVLLEKLAKRGVPLNGLDPQALEPAKGSHVKKRVLLKRGMKPDDARRVVGLVKEMGLKVQAAIQGESVRITGKKKDDLQAVMERVRAAGFDFPVAFQNFRD